MADSLPQLLMELQKARAGLNNAALMPDPPPGDNPLHVIMGVCDRLTRLLADPTATFSTEDLKACAAQEDVPYSVVIYDPPYGVCTQHSMESIREAALKRLVGA